MPDRVTGLATTELALTGKRVLGRTGLLRRKRLSLPHKQIETVKASRGILGVLFNYGTVTISGSDGARLKFRGIADPETMVQRCNEAAEIAILGRMLNDIPLPPLEEGSPNFPLPQLGGGSGWGLTRESLPIKSPTLPSPQLGEEKKPPKDPNAW